jgi:hypothetical protein
MLALTTWAGRPTRHASSKTLLVRTMLGGNFVGKVVLMQSKNMYNVVRDAQQQVGELLVHPRLTSRYVWMRLGEHVISPTLWDQGFSERRAKMVAEALAQDVGVLDVKYLDDTACTKSLDGLSVTAKFDELVVHGETIHKGVARYNNGWNGRCITKVSFYGRNNFCDLFNLAWPGLEFLQLFYARVPIRMFPRFAQTFCNLTTLVLDTSLEGSQSFASFNQLATLELVNFEGCSAITDLPASLEHLVLKYAVNKEQLPHMSNLVNLQTLKARCSIKGRVPDYVLALPRLSLVDLRHNDVVVDWQAAMRVKLLV